MNLGDADISRIIERVQLSLGQVEGVSESMVGGDENTLVLVPSFVPAPKKALSYLAQHYGSSIRLVFLSRAEFDAGELPKTHLDWETQKNELVNLLVTAEHAVLLAPETGMLARMRGGTSGNDCTEALLRRILWGKKVDILLDFDPPTFRRGTYFAELAESIDMLSTMGIRFITYQPVESETSGVCALVTERDVVEAKQSGQKSIRCAKNAIVTPLAVDTARELQINIEYV